MENEYDLVTSGVGNSESPGSALLERLKNLRRWQEEQRRELLQNQSVISHQTSAFLESENIEKPHSEHTQELQHMLRVAEDPHSKDKEQATSDAVVRDSHVELSQKYTGISMRNSQGSSHGYLHDNFESVNAVSSSFSNKQSDGGPMSSIKVTQERDISHVHVSPSFAEQERKERSRELLPRSSETYYPKQEDAISNQEVVLEKNDIHNGLYESKMYTKDRNLKYENETVKKVQGLSNFIKHHADAKEPSESVGHRHDLETKEDMESTTKPKFTFLRKGEGISRFGMKPVRLKPKIDKKEAESSSAAQRFDKEHENLNSIVNRKASAIVNVIPSISSNTYPSRIGNRPIKSLKVQKESVKTSSNDNFAENTGGKELKIRSDITVPTKLSRTVDNIQQKQNGKPSKADYEKQGHKEREELSAFEKLEELAEDSSFSSNSSTVVRLLRRGQHSNSSTPIRSPPPTPHLTPILSSVDHESYDRQHTQGGSTKLLDRVEEVGIFLREACQQDQFPNMSVSHILEQLRSIVRLDGIDDSSISEKELKALIESCVDQNASLPPESVSHFANNMRHASINPTSTPTEIQPVLPARPRVHFRPEGVEVLEYELTESDDENTLTETPSIVDDTDLVTTSDLEILAQFDTNIGATSDRNIEKQPSNKIHAVVGDESSSPYVENPPKFASKSENREHLQPVKLQFSPPSFPKNSASHYVWSIFGKEKGLKKSSQPQKLNSESVKTKNSSLKSKETVYKKIDEKASATLENENGNQLEVETYKTLLLAKVCELEKETESFKKENHSLKKLQETLQRERSQLDSERKVFQEEIEREKKKLRDYIDSERNVLWKEKQALKLQTPSVTSVRDQNLEIVYLKEQLHDLQEEAKKKESSHNFAVRKLNEKIKTLEEEVRVLKDKNITLQKLEKENIKLKHELDRAKLSKRPVPNIKPGNRAAGKLKPRPKIATLSSINKSLDKVDGNDMMANERSVMKCSLEPRRTSNTEQHNLNDLKNLQENKEPRGTQDFESSSGSVKDSYEILQGNKEKDRHLDNLQHPLVGLDQESLSSTVPVKREEEHTRMMKGKASPISLGNQSIHCTELCRDDGTREIIYSNGNKKELFTDGSMIISYYNGDRKEVHEDRTVYVYGTDLTSHTTFSDGKEVLEFPNGQKETRFSDGSSEIIFSDNTRKTVLADGTEICSMKDGTIVRTNPEGVKVFEFVSGQREVHTPEEKRREYPDGTVKILHPDGRTETRYKKGRVRIKDKEGNILIDTHQSVQ